MITRGFNSYFIFFVLKKGSLDLVDQIEV